MNEVEKMGLIQKSSAHGFLRAADRFSSSSMPELQREIKSELTNRQDM